MSRWFYAAAFAVAALLGLVAVTQPMMALAALGVIVITLLFFVVPGDKVALFAGAAVISLLVLVPVQNISSYGNLKYAVLGAVGALTVGTIARRRASLDYRPKGLWLFAAYFALVGLATPRSLEPASWNLLFGAVVAGLAPAITFAFMNAIERRQVLKFLVAVAAAEAAYSLFELIARTSPLWGYASVTKTGDPNLMYNQIDMALIRSQGTLGHPLPLALLLLVGLALVVRGVGPASALMRVLTAALLFAGCFAAGSRSAMAVAVVLILLGIGRKRWKAIVVGGYLLILGAVVAVAAGFLESAAFQRFAASDSLSHRTGAVDAIPGLLEGQDFVNTVFGNGYFSAYQLYREGLLQVGNFFAVDNQFVMTLVEGGLSGLAVLVVLVIVAFRKIGRTARLGLLSVVFFFLSFDVLSWPSGMALFGLFVGLAFSDPKTEETSSLEGPSTLTRARTNFSYV
ncbi:O-antigen ligase family protein [Arthrobacter oryzae]|uniref:O-antigen ligase family protein n=1 Tax=Arthrobacter oryzae TaxID=409290 RepID=UPI002860007B|nr:O-antigen ligase family protein [Arthrobacter oryzae]MDR6505109.1 O-antigen ligase [Arthrobacter oryzae]